MSKHLDQKRDRVVPRGSPEAEYRRDAILAAVSWRSRLLLLISSVDHRRQLARARLAPSGARARAVAGRLQLRLAALATQRRRGQRHDDLTHVVRELPTPSPSDRRVALIVVDSTDSLPQPEAELVCLVTSQVEPIDEHWLDRLAAPIGGSVVATTPALVHPERSPLPATPHDLLVWGVGLRVAADRSDEPTLEAVGAGGIPGSVLRAPGPVDAASTCLMVDRAALEHIGGIRETGDALATIVDVALRLRAAGGVIASVPEALVFDRSTVPSIRALRHPLVANDTAWREIVGLHGPALRREAAGAGLKPRVAITTPAPPGLIARRWGDWELAQALARSLGRVGVETRVQTRDQADDLASRTSDVHLVIRGMRSVRRTSGQKHVLWVISHPEELGGDELDEADLVLAASERLARSLRDRTSTPVEVLLQGTDHDRFRPVPPSRAHGHPILIAANTRGELRSSVAYALETGVRPAIYGDGWDKFVERSLIVQRHVPNQLLPTLYCSAGVVLNDHWASMREWGMVSNRIYDVLACGAPVISDFLPEIEAQFDGAVPMFRDADELHDMVMTALDDPVKARRRAAQGRERVLAHHTLDRRAIELVEYLGDHGLLPGP